MNGKRPLLHEASDEGKIAGYNAVHEKKSFKRRTPLNITFTDPNIGYYCFQLFTFCSRVANSDFLQYVSWNHVDFKTSQTDRRIGLSQPRPECPILSVSVIRLLYIV